MNMECINNTYHCLCAYLLDGELSLEKLRSIEQDANLCPKCRGCKDREKELKLQREIRSLIQKQCSHIAVPDHIREKVISELDRSEDYRESGIPNVDLIPWGTHIALLYNTDHDLSEILAAYIEKGLEGNELCVLVTNMPEDEAKLSLIGALPNIDECVNQGQLQLFSYKKHEPEPSYEVQCILDNCIMRYQELSYRNFSGIRITGDISSINQPEWNSLVKYEEFINSIITDHKAIILCTYKESECNADNIANIVDTHKYVISRVNSSWKII